MEVRQILLKGGIPVIDPKLMKETPDEYLAKYGSYLDAICVVAKSEAGSTNYPSFTAPKDQEFGEFFAAFSQIANDIGIQVFAQINCNNDHYLSGNPNFSMIRSGGNPVQGMVCPSRQQYWFYLSEIAAEVAKYPIDGIILKDASFPTKDTCFCESCRREFADANITLDRQFSYDQLEREPNLQAQWQERRLNSIWSMLTSIKNRVHSEITVEIIPDISIDSKTNYLIGASQNFGQDLRFYTQMSQHIMLHINPWSGDVPAPGSPEFGQLVDSLAPLVERRGTLTTSLYTWGADDAKIQFMEALKDTIASKYLFVQKEPPLSLQDQRSLRLGLL